MNIITSKKLFNLLNTQNDTLLIDVRSIDEYEEEHIEKSINIEMNELLESSEKYLPKFKNTKVYFVCRSGGRSGVVTQLFSEKGIDAYNVDGGIITWSQTNLPLVK